MYGVSLRDELFCYLMSLKISKQNIPGMYERTCQNLFPTSLPFRVLQITTYYHPLSTSLSLFQPFRSVRLLSLWQEGFATHDCLTFLTLSLSLTLFFLTPATSSSLHSLHERLHYSLTGFACLLCRDL